MENLTQSRRIVIKIGTSTLTHTTGHLNLRRIESLVKTVSDFKNAGHQVILVSSGAVGAGLAKLGLDHRPRTPEEKQAVMSQLTKGYDIDEIRVYEPSLNDIFVEYTGNAAKEGAK